MKSIAILASHNGSGFDAIYEAIQTGELSLKVAVVISNNNNAQVIKKAQNLSLDYYIVNSSTDEIPDDKIYELLKEHECEYIFLSGYMKKLSSVLTNNFHIINSHPALLPKYGGKGMYGRFVHEAVLKNGERVSGVTIHEVDEIYDNGKILLQKEIALENGESVASLEMKIKELEKKAIVEALKECLN